MQILTSIWRWLQRLLLITGAFFFLITCTPMDSWWATALAGPWDDPKGDVLILLTGAGMEDGIIGENSYWRAVYAERVYKAHEVSEVLITGGGAEKPPIAATMRDFMIGQGVPAEAIRVEVAANSTRDSAVNIARMIAAEPERYGNNRKLVLMTSDYHMYRSARVFAKAGVKAAPRPIPDVRKRQARWLERVNLFGELVLETVKIVYYKVRGWI